MPAPGSRRCSARRWPRPGVDGSLASRRPATHLPGDCAGTCARVGEEAGALPPTDVACARHAAAWTSVFGAVSFEVFGQYGAGHPHRPRQLFEHHLDRMVEQVGLIPEERA